MTNWQDTVMEIGELFDIEEAVEDAVFSGKATDTKPVAIAKAQAEISFKAGIKEVVEWVEKGGLGQYGWSEDFRTKWQAKLKEWGIK